MRRLVLPITIIIIGFWIWLSNIGLLAFHRDWPWIIILFGIWRLVKALKNK
ncbi:MAG: hypothetical protein N2201_06570 [candidate division WOR-3 bacterium]|nr:hypothetical protein [candidate division WOR-3 bacterium]